MDVFKSLVPLFIETEIPKRIKQIGTAIFLEFQSEPFLFTAAHVTDDRQYGKLLAPTINGLSEIDGYLAHIDMPPEIKRSSDTVDMAYYRLSSTFASELCFHFLPLQKKIEIIPSALELSVVSVVGYPASKSKKKGTSFSSELMYYRGVAASQEVYDHHNLSPEESTIIHFHEKRSVSPADGQKYKPPSPKGVSGGAIFAWPPGHGVSDDWSLPKLVGVFHTYKKSEGLFIGTNIISYAAATSLGKMKNYDGVI